MNFFLSLKTIVSCLTTSFKFFKTSEQFLSLSLQAHAQAVLLAMLRNLLILLKRDVTDQVLQNFNAIHFFHPKLKKFYRQTISKIFSTPSAQYFPIIFYLFSRHMRFFDNLHVYFYLA